MRNILLTFVFLVGGLSAIPAHAAGFLEEVFGVGRQPQRVVYQYAPAQPQLNFVYDEGFRVSRRSPMAKKYARTKQQIMADRLKKLSRKAALKRKLAHQNAKLLQTGKFAAITAPGLNVDLKPTATGEGKLQRALCCKNGEDPGALIVKDETLRIGDAYMTPQGLRIYRGRAAISGRAAFIDYRKAGLGNDMKARYAALEQQQARAAAVAAANAASKRSPQPQALVAPSPAPAQAKASSVSPAPNRTSLDPLGRTIRVVGP